MLKVWNFYDDKSAAILTKILWRWVTVYYTECGADTTRLFEDSKVWSCETVIENVEWSQTREFSLALCWQSADKFFPMYVVFMWSWLLAYHFQMIGSKTERKSTNKLR